MYDAVEMWLQVVNESLSNMDPTQPCKGDLLISRFLNRTFELETGTVFIGSSGIKLLDLDVFSFDNESMTMKVMTNN